MTQQSSVLATPNRTRPGYEAAARLLIDKIRVEGLKQGDRLPPERLLAEEFHVGRTVIREAVKMLITSGILHVRQGSGIYVHDSLDTMQPIAMDFMLPLDPKQATNLFEFRRVQEMETAALAAERISPREVNALEKIVHENALSAEQLNYEEFERSDSAFHRCIAEATHNPFWVSAVINNLRLQQRFVHTITHGSLVGVLRIAAEQHQSIFHAIKQGDSQTARKCMDMHIAYLAESFEEESRRRIFGKETMLSEE